jgi:hypothetical protein
MLVPETGIEPVRPLTGKRRILSRWCGRAATAALYENLSEESSARRGK